MELNNKVIVLLGDLFFHVKIQEAVRRSDLEAIFTGDSDRVVQHAAARPVAVVLDLNYAAGRPMETIQALKAERQTREIPLIGYVSHVQVDVNKSAREAGCDVVFARSALISNLPSTLALYRRTSASAKAAAADVL